MKNIMTFTKDDVIIHCEFCNRPFADKLTVCPYCGQSRKEEVRKYSN